MSIKPNGERKKNETKIKSNLRKVIILRVKYKKPASKSGRLTVHLPADIVSDISVICRIKDIPMTRYVNDTLKNALIADFRKLKEAAQRYE